jgi:glycosyltransferase involved in cell wall biosynthesis
VNFPFTIQECRGDSLQPLVSVVIPTFNRPYFLCELLESLCHQTYLHFEVIIVNDQGDSVDFVKTLYPELPIHIIELEQKSYHVMARNEGVKRAKGEYILLCDDDDLLLPTHIETMVLEIDGYDLVYSDVEIFHYEIKDQVRIPTHTFLFAYEYDPAGMRKFSTFVPSGTLYKKSIHETIGYFDPSVSHYWDWDFFLRVSEHFRVKRVPVASVLYAFSATGHQSSNPEVMRPYLDRLCEKHQLGFLPTKNFFLLLEEPEVQKRRAESRRIWDQKPILSRLVNNKLYSL